MWNRLNYSAGSFVTYMQNYYPDFSYNFSIIKKKKLDTESVRILKKTRFWTHI